MQDYKEFLEELVKPEDKNAQPFILGEQQLRGAAIQKHSWIHAANGCRGAALGMGSAHAVCS
jgi:hypothetical protein